MLGIRFPWHGKDGCLGEVSRKATKIYVVHVIFRERDQFRVSRTFFVLLPPMLSQTGIFGHTQTWSQSNSIALSCSIASAFQQLRQYLGFGRFGISSGSDTNFCGLGHTAFWFLWPALLTILWKSTGFTLAPKWSMCMLTWLGQGRFAQKPEPWSWAGCRWNCSGFRVGVFRWKLCWNRCTKTPHWHLTTIFLPILVSLNRTGLQNCSLKWGLGPMGGDLHR